MATRWSIRQGDLRQAETFAQYPDNYFDALFCDAPYGLSPDGRARTWDQIDHQRARGGFMGQAWDAAVPGETFWRECLRVLKPGAPLIAYCGTRTYHRMVGAIEDAGFDIRDMCLFLHSVGFPKSLDLSKAVDAHFGDERPVHGTQTRKNAPSGLVSIGRDSETIERKITSAASAASAAWEGYGTALKPANESLVWARKPLNDDALTGAIANSIMEAVCRLPLHASAAEKTSASSHSGQPSNLASAQWNAVARCSTPADLFDLMATWPSALDRPLNLSTALSWLLILAECSGAMSTCTTEITTSLTTDLRTLNSYRSLITPELITLASMNRAGTNQHASLVVALFDALSSRLRVTRTLSAPGVAISTDGAEGLRPDVEPLVLARKPLDGTYAENALKWGVGGLAIDACRIQYASADDQAAAAAAAAAAQRLVQDQNANRHAYGQYTNGEASLEPYLAKQSLGRWPANVIFDEAAADLLDETVGDRPSMLTGRADPNGSHSHTSNAETASWFHAGAANASKVYADGGGPSRFFFTAKVSRFEREFGCDNLDETSAGDRVGGRDEDSAAMNSPRTGAGRTGGARNSHPTLKGIAQTEYFAKLILPPPRTDGVPRRLFVPFAGAGSEMCGALRAGWDEVHGVEMSEKFIAIAAARIDRWMQLQAGVDVKDVRSAAANTNDDPRQVPLFGKAGT